MSERMKAHTKKHESVDINAANNSSKEKLKFKTLSIVVSWVLSSFKFGKKNNEEIMSENKKKEENLTKCLKESESCVIDKLQMTSLKSDLKKQNEHLNEQNKHLNEQNKYLKNVIKQYKILTYNMDKERRILHNTIQELKGNIRVFCRVRPRTPNEVKQMKPLCSLNMTESTIEVGKLNGSDAVSYSGKLRETKQEFTFDKVFPPTASQKDIFEEISLLVQSALEGFNVCIFAYGQTGSGKTYTMEGGYDLQTEGIIPRTVCHIFKEIKQLELLGWEYRIEATFLEIYNEQIVDLLDLQPKDHRIRMADAKSQDLYVTNLSVKEIHGPEDLYNYLKIAQYNRAVAATQSNERSSRSHSVTRIRLIGTHSVKEEVSIGNLNLIDLASSERLKTEEAAARIIETKNINKSLANLGNVISAIIKNQEHIPFRNSKLTHLLMPSLGGNSKTTMFLNISPLNEHYNETINALRFANDVNNCKIEHKRNLKFLSHKT